MVRKYRLIYAACIGFFMTAAGTCLLFTGCSRVDLFSDNKPEPPEDVIPTPEPTTLPPCLEFPEGGQGANRFFGQADSMLCHFTRDKDNDGTDDLENPALCIPYFYSPWCGEKHVVVPDQMLLFQPVISSHTYTHGDRSVCTICLDKTDIDCDYLCENSSGMIVMPFKGELLLTDTRVMIDPATGDGSTWGKPDPDAVDFYGNSILHIEFQLCSVSGQEEKRITPVDLDFFWNHYNTWVYFDNTQNPNISKLVWDMDVEFPKNCVDSLEEVKMFMIMDIPIRGSFALKATAFIIPEDYFDGTPFRYGIDEMKNPDVEYITVPSIRFFY